MNANPDEGATCIECGTAEGLILTCNECGDGPFCDGCFLEHLFADCEEEEGQP